MDYFSIVGIDVASEKLDLCWGSALDTVAYATVASTEEALTQFLTDHPDLTPALTLIGMESTGEYHLLAARFFLERGYAVRILNPIITKQYARATVRGIKTDKTDAAVIWKLVREGQGDAADLETLTNRAKELLRLSQSLTQNAAQLKVRLQSTVRKSVGNTEEIQAKLEEIIAALDILAKELVEEATENRSEAEERIDSIPGFAVKLSAVVHHELGDITRFPNARSLVAYAGIDPRIRQSGTLNTHGRLTKRGSPYLRSALFLAANVARRYDSELAEYYQKKRTEGRTHKEVLCIISRKLLARIFAVLKEHRPYLKR